MEKCIKKLIIILLFSSSLLAAQTPSIINHIRIPMWASLDAYPGLEDAQDVSSGIYDYPIKSIRELGPFLITGMVYGWKFVYTPSDKARGVEEYFELTEIQSLDPAKDMIHYASPWIQDNKLNCWCEFTRDEFQVRTYYLWSSIQNPTIHGRGYGDLTKGFDGLKDAANDAVKNAVREYFRTKYKNKPKEITGSVLIRELPIIGISAGRYVINLDFFMECGKITEYKVY